MLFWYDDSKLRTQLVDSLLVKPSLTSTSMTNFANNNLSVLPEQCTFGCLTSLGHLKETGGAFKHLLKNIQCNNLKPWPLLNWEKAEMGRTGKEVEWKSSLWRAVSGK